jgi:hypothetical protein
MIKFVVAAVWLCAATVGALFYSFQNAGSAAAPEAPAAMLGGLDYIKTEVVSVPLLKDGQIKGYFLTRLVYTVDPKMLQQMSVPAEALIVDQVYSYLYGNPLIDFEKLESMDPDAFRGGIREAVNKRIGQELIHEVLIEQVDFLSKAEIRDNSIRRRVGGSEKKEAEAKPAPKEGGHH